MLIGLRASWPRLQGRLATLKPSRIGFKTVQTQINPERLQSKQAKSRVCSSAFSLLHVSVLLFFCPPRKTIMNSSFSTLKIFVKKITFYVHCMQQSRKARESRAGEKVFLFCGTRIHKQTIIPFFCCFARLLFKRSSVLLLWVVNKKDARSSSGVEVFARGVESCKSTNQKNY